MISIKPNFTEKKLQNLNNMAEVYHYAFEKLEVWKKGKELVIMIYQYTRHFPKEEQHGLSKQMRRAAVSIISNLAEGTARQSTKDRSHFSVIAYSSLMELVNQTILSYNLGFIDQEKYKRFRELSTEVSRLLHAFREAQKKL